MHRKVRLCVGLFRRSLYKYTRADFATTPYQITGLAIIILRYIYAVCIWRFWQGNHHNMVIYGVSIRLWLIRLITGLCEFVCLTVCAMLHCVPCCTVCHAALCAMLHCVQCCTVCNAALCAMLRCYCCSMLYAILDCKHTHPATRHSLCILILAQACLCLPLF
jgi:hypothetical protein